MNNLKSYYNIGTDTEIIIQIIVNGKFKNMIKKKIHRKSNPMLNFLKKKEGEIGTYCGQLCKYNFKNITMENKI